ncbi:MAG: GGDEF domain-containing protein [Helicobacteraceae bacterium]|jgi:diguanylate cyclase (GGDEF)-like protein|nr:GGDEF domain-containing protein [Helicobacteraceae bacterium]
MNDDSILAQDILNKLNVATLKREGPNRYRVFGDPPAFYNKLFPPSKNGPCVSPWDISPMLETFVIDAETFFERKVEGCFSSGVWQEDGAIDGDIALVAEAMSLKGKEAIIIRLLQQDFSDRATVLNHARIQLLQKREISKNLDHYREKSRLDALTGLLNRATFMEALLEAIDESNNKFAPLSLLMLDVDNFKNFNDTFGHLAGDEVLRSLGAFLRSKCRSDDIAAKYGGEEFCIILRGASQEETLRVGQKICEGVREIKVASLPTITVSVGCAVYHRNESAEQLIKRADMALYDVKRSAKNGVAIR